MSALDLAKSMTNLSVGGEVTTAQWNLAEVLATTDLAVMLKTLGVEDYASDPLCEHAKAFLIKRQVSFITLEFVPDRTVKGRNHYDQNADGVDYNAVQKFREDMKTEAENILKTLKPVFAESYFVNVKAKR